MSDPVRADAPVDRAVARSSAVMAVGTVASRASGFVRAALIAAVLGTGAVADVFTVPNTIPNALYVLVAGGVLNSVLVPQLVRAIKSDPDGGAAYAQRLVTAASAVLLVATAIAVAAAPWLVRLYVSDAMLRPENQPVYDSMVALARFTLPQIFFYGYYVLLGQVLNAHGRFGPMMFAPILNNVVAVLVFGGYLVVVGTKTDPVFSTAEAAWFGVGSTLGIAVQALVLVPLVQRAGVSLRPRRDLRGFGLGKAARLAGWTVAFVAVNQLTLIVVVRLSTIGTAGSLGTDGAAGLAAYQNAFLLAMAPHSVLTVSLATALLPTMSARAASGDLAAVGAELAGAMRTCTSIIAPVAGLLWASAGLVTTVLFGWGAAASQTGSIADVLLLMAPGLLFFTLHYLALRGFYALEDTRTPFLVQIAVGATNVAAALGLTRWLLAADRPDLVAVALAASWSLAYLVGSMLSLSVLHRRLGAVGPLRQLAAALHAVLAAAPGTVLVLLVPVVAPGPRGPGTSLLLFVAAALVAAATYLVAARIVRLREPAALIRQLVRRRGDGGDAGPSGGAGAPPSQPSTDQPPTDQLPTDRAVDEAPEEDVDEAAVGDDRPWWTGPPTQPHLLADRLDADAAGVPPTVPPAAPPAAPPEAPRSAGRAEAGPPGEAATWLLRRRYRLLDRLGAPADGKVTWYSHDDVLGRPVLVQTLPAAHPRAEALIAAARHAALARDPRLLRVLDADVDTPVDARLDRAGTRAAGAVEPGALVYVVREWVDGRNLADLLLDGPLDADEAATLAYEVAAALGSAHRDGLVHGQLAPDQVIVAHDGSVKLTGLETELATHLGSHRQRTGRARAAEMAADTRGVAKLLYAGLTGRWPRDPSGLDTVSAGLPDAPVHDGHPVLPRQVRAGVPRALDDVVARALDQRRPRPDALRTVDAVAEALAPFTVRHAGGAVLSGSRLHAAVLPVVRAHAGTPSPGTSTGSVGVGTAPAGASRAAAADRADAGDAPAPSRTSTVLAVAVALVLLAGAVLLALQLLLPSGLTGDRTDPREPAGDATGTPVARPVQGATDFDPLGDGSENPQRTARAVDDDPQSSWRTSTYYTPLADQKAGVGLVLDLGEAATVRELTVQLVGSPTSLQVRTAPADASSPPDGPGGWAVAATADDAEHTAEIRLDDPVTTRFVLLWFTDLPAVAGGWRAEVRDVEIRG